MVIEFKPRLVKGGAGALAPDSRSQEKTSGDLLGALAFLPTTPGQAQPAIEPDRAIDAQKLICRIQEIKDQ